MRIYVFVSQVDPDNIVGFTLDKGGINLPDNLGPWVQEDMPGIAVRTETDDSISDAVQRDGFCVVDYRSAH
jgi:hypothetical protein